MKEVASLNSKQPKSKIKDKSKISFHPLIAFGITVICYIFLCFVCDVFPFGKFSVSVSDLTAQYAPFLALFRNKIVSLSQSDNLVSALTYSFQSGLGKNFMSTYGYYLGSPFNLLYALINVAYIDAFVVFLMVIKLSFASAFMCMFLRERNDNKNSKLPILFGVIYSFTAYIVAFIFQIMWLDGYMLLPLLLFFVEKFIKKDKYIGIICTLLILFVSNYYIAYMVGAFSFFYLLARLYVEDGFKPLKKGIRKVLKFIILAVISALIVSVVIVPVGIDTLKSADQTVASASDDFVKYTAIDLIDQFFLGIPGTFGEVLPSNFPFFFISLMVTLLMTIYVVSKIFNGKEKKVHIAALIFTYLSTAIYWFDIAWQAFDTPNWFWHRQAFVFLPIFLVIAQKTLEKIKEIPKKDIYISFAILLGLLFIDHALGQMKNNDKMFLYNIVVLSVFLGMLLLLKKEVWHEQLRDMPQLLPAILSVLIVFECVYLAPLNSSEVATFTIYNGEANDYIESIVAMEDVGLISKELNTINDSFRAENERIDSYSLKHNLAEGEAMYGNFHGMSFFNSSSNKYLHHFMKQLGYPVNYNYFAQVYSYQAPSTDAFLSIGVVSSLRDYKYGLKYGVDYNDCGFTYYANKDVLPLAFSVKNSAMDFDFYQLESMEGDKNYFDFQNRWYKSMFDEYSEDFFITLPDDVVGDMNITNAMTYNEGDYQVREAILKKESLENEKKKEDSSEEVTNRDPLGKEPGESESETKYYRSNENIPMVFEYEFDAPNDKELYLNLSTRAATNATTVCVNGIKIADASNGTFYSQIYRLGAFEPGEKVKVSILSDGDTWSYMDINFAYFDDEVFTKQFDSMNISDVKVNKVSDGFVNISTNLKNDDILLTTVPYEEGWTLKIDGKETEITSYQNAFIAAKVPEGQHEVVLEFVAPGFKTGAIMSGIGILSFVAFVLIDKKKKNLTEK